MDEIEHLEGLSPSERAEVLLRLGPRVAAGESDSSVVARLASIAMNEDVAEVKDAWLTYIVASKSREFVPVLEAWSDDADEEMRLGVVSALAWVLCDRTSEILLGLVENDPSVRVRRNALRYLVRRGSLGQWKPVDLFAITQDEDWRPVTRREYLELLRKGVARPR